MRRRGFEEVLILAALLELGGEAPITVLAKEAGVSYETVRRNLSLLQECGFVDEEYVFDERSKKMLHMIRLTERGREAAEHAKAILDLITGERAARGQR